VDLGSPYNNNELSKICARLGISLIHTPIRDCQSKGKIEKSFATIKSRWLHGFDEDSVHSLAEYNNIVRGEIRKRNLEINLATGQTPIDRYTAADKHVRIPPSPEWLNEAFMHRVTRKVSNDATIRCKPHLFDAPRQFIGQTVEVRFLPDQWEGAYIYYEDNRYPLKITDKNENAITKRNNDYSIDYSKR